MKKGFLLIVFLFLIPLVLGASIHGKVFTYSFKPANNAVVNINTVPMQIIVSTDGTYSFDIPIGNYTIIAVLKDELDIIRFSVETNISIIDNGDYVRDLILFPYEQLDELDLEEDIEQDLEQEIEIHKIPVLNRIIISIALILILAFIVWLAIRDKGKKKDLIAEIDEQEVEIQGIDDELTNILSFIKKHKRVTQKQIRKEFPMSEAKISLTITDLESQGKVRKIKKGRGNVIVYSGKK